MQMTDSTKDGAPRSVRAQGPREAPRGEWRRVAAMCAGLLVLPIVGWLIFAPRSSGAPSRRADASSSEPRRAAPREAPRAPSSRDDDRPRASAGSSPARGSGQGVEGEVVGPDDKPVASASVRCTVGDRELEASTDEGGRFHFGDEADGCKAVAKKKGFATSSEGALHLGGGNRLRLGPGSGIAGTVVDASGSPMMTFWIGVESFEAPGGADAGDAPRPAAMEVNDTSGAFLLEDLPAGRYVLAANAARHPIVRSAPIDVSAGSVTRDVKLTLKPGGTVVGTVVDATTKAPLTGAMVFAEMSTKSGIRSIPGIALPPAGEFHLEGACPEKCELRVFLPGYVDKRVPDLIVPPSGEPLRVDVALTRPGEAPP